MTDSNKKLIVETFRAIAEILIWGDQNDSSVFDFFLEKNMQSYFLRTLNQNCGRYVVLQLLQTLSILFDNIRNETSIYYLLSNNHVNSIIVLKLDFSDEEVLAYYISFLKTLSFKLNKHTIHFFYNEVESYYIILHLFPLQICIFLIVTNRCVLILLIEFKFSFSTCVISLCILKPSSFSTILRVWSV
jgi:hypothetical protein